MIIGIDGRPLQEKFGGVKEFTLNLLHAIFSLDQKNEYHVFYNSFNEIQLPNFTQYPNVKIRRFRWPNKILNLSLRLFNYPKLNKLIANSKLDLFYLPNLNFTAFDSDQNYIITIHDLSFCHFPYFYSLKQQWWHKAIKIKNLLKKASRIIAVSEHTKNDIVETFDIVAEKIEVIYPCLTPSLYPLPVRERIVNEDYILSLGTLEPRKNIESLIEAYKILKKNPPQSPFAKGGGKGDFPKLVIAGPKGWKYKKIFQTVAPEIKNDIIFLGAVSDEEKIALYQNAKIFIYPSFYEGFGLPPLEAQSQGAPVIASASSSLPEILGDGALYVNPWNATELAQTMDFLLNNENEQQKLSQAGRQQATKFQNQTIAEKLLKIFEETGKI